MGPGTSLGAPPPASIPPCLCVPHTGPVNIHDRVLRAMNVPGQNHRDPWFADFYREVLEDSKFVFQTKVSAHMHELTSLPSRIGGTLLAFHCETPWLYMPTVTYAHYHIRSTLLIHCFPCTGGHPIHLPQHWHWRLGVCSPKHTFPRGQSGDFQVVPLCRCCQSSLHDFLLMLSCVNCVLNLVEGVGNAVNIQLLLSNT